MKKTKFFLFSGIAFCAVLATQSCASAPMASARRGLLDRMLVLPSGAKPIEAVEVAEDHRLSPMSAEVFRKYRNVSFRWPLGAVQVTSNFGKRGGDFHEGIDLRANVGTPVYAAHGGRVLYAGGRIQGYGQMVILSHKSGLATVYAHNAKLFVRKGDSIIRGQRIASSGKTGRVRGAHLHFEVRMGPRPVNPLEFYEGIRKASAELRPAHPTAGRTKRNRSIASN